MRRRYKRYERSADEQKIMDHAQNKGADRTLDVEAQQLVARCQVLAVSAQMMDLLPHPKPRLEIVFIVAVEPHERRVVRLHAGQWVFGIIYRVVWSPTVAPAIAGEQ